MLKKIAVLSFAAAILVTGCTDRTTKTTDNSETLRIFFSDMATPDKDMVAAEVSKITKEKLGINVEFVMFGIDEYFEKIPMLLASDEKMDIGFDAGWKDYVSRSRKGAYHGLSNLLSTKGELLYNTIDTSLWKGVSIDGEIYGIPTYKEVAEQWAVLAEEDVLKANNIDPASIKKLADAEVVLQALKKEPKRAGFMVTATNGGQHVAFNKLEYFDVITDDFMVLRADGKVVSNYYLSEQYKDFVALMRDWYEKGYIADNVATRDNYDEYERNGIQNYGLGYQSYAPFNEVTSSRSYGKTLIPMMVTERVISNNSTRGSIYSIFKKSTQLEKAFEFLQLWNTDPQIKNLITYGIEGKHYTLTDGRVEKVKDFEKYYFNQNWKTGNIFISYLLKGEPDNKYEEFMKFNTGAIEAVNLGFTPDISKMADKMAACSAAVKEFTPLLNVGAIDPDEYLPRLESNLKTAGVDDICKELQSQYDKWLADKQR